MVLIVGDQGMTTTIDVPTRVNRGVSGGIQPNAHKDIQKIEAQAVSFRRSEQEAQLQSRLAEGVKAGATTLWNIMVAEEAKKMWKQTPIPQSYEPKNIEAALLKRNRIHFGQAQGTPPLREKINWSASNDESELILEGDHNMDSAMLSDESELMLEGDLIDSAMLSAAEKLMLTHFRRTTNLDTITA
ncbi:hypothetical protein IV203_017609 [Nitzschia inconspicua]|uniref:Uncharacterized protein n=1 Tax=Nitzschia inconspicua TaxID=303405 RepID=A0A9K3P7Q2_9STRA|nr:hypothetical protein IV203_017609 [Nitzschia inconspicua]